MGGKECLKCGHVTTAAQDAEPVACERCGAVFAKVEAAKALAAERAAMQKQSAPTAQRPWYLRRMSKQQLLWTYGVAFPILIGLGLAVLQRIDPADTPSPPAQSSARSDNVLEAEADRCFGVGERLAYVYIANMKAAAEVGLMASRVMDEGCAREIAEACVSRCKAGFRSQAKRFVGN